MGKLICPDNLRIAIGLDFFRISTQHNTSQYIRETNNCKHLPFGTVDAAAVSSCADIEAYVLYTV
jgi:hypothetical protein